MRLTRDEVIAQYGPVPDPLWTPEVEAKFFASLPVSTRKTIATAKRLSEVKSYAVKVLGANRMSESYLATLSLIMERLEYSLFTGVEFKLSQRDESLGTARTIRTIQGQMDDAGLLVRVTRAQGHGFVGDVFIFEATKQDTFMHRHATDDLLEHLYRSTEGVSHCPYLPGNLTADDVPY